MKDKKEYYKKNREKIKKKAKEYREKNREIILKRKKEHYKKNKKRIAKKRKNYYLKNKEKIDKRNKKWRKEHPNYMKKWREKNGEKLEEYSKEYYKKNRKKIIKKSKKYRKEYYPKYYQKNKERLKKQNNNYQKNRKKTDEDFRVKSYLRISLYKALKHYTKTGKIMTSKKYGIDYNAIIKYLKPFPKDLSNYEIHHIKPLHTFNFINKDGTTNLKEVSKAFTPKNHKWVTKEEHKEIHRKEI